MGCFASNYRKYSWCVMTQVNPIINGRLLFAVRKFFLTSPRVFVIAHNLGFSEKAQNATWPSVFQPMCMRVCTRGTCRHAGAFVCLPSGTKGGLVKLVDAEEAGCWVIYLLFHKWMNSHSMLFGGNLKQQLFTGPNRPAERVLQLVLITITWNLEISSLMTGWSEFRSKQSAHSNTVKTFSKQLKGGNWFSRLMPTIEVASPHYSNEELPSLSIISKLIFS